ncbi:MAG: sialate O-acetylesterase [Roseibacillus sp.]
MSRTLRRGLWIPLLCGNIATADITLSSSAPTTDILSSTGLGSTDTSLFPLLGSAPSPIAGNANHARGQLFSLGDGTGVGFEISAITFQKNIAATFANDSLTLRIFRGNEAAWNSGSGHVASDSDFYKDTTVTPLYEEVFTVNGTIPDNEFITLELDSPLTVDENSDFGFFLTYDPATGTSPDRFRHLESNSGGRISITTTDHGTSSRAINCFIQGVPVSATAGTISTSSSAPTVNIIDSSSVGAIDTALFDEDANANHGRGQLFTLPNGSGSDYEVSAITIRKSNDQTFTNDKLTLHLFEGTEAQWNSGTGHTTATNGSNYYAGTTVTPLYQESYLLNGTLTNNDYITFELSSPVTVNEDSDFGFFLIYEQDDATNPTSFRHREDGTNGGRLSISTTSHGTSPSRKVLYFIEGTPVGNGAELDLASPFQDRMILQRDKPVKLWGTANAGSTIVATIDSNTINGTTDPQGDWEVQLPQFAAGGPYTLTVTSTSLEGTASKTVSDILFGDVWVCFGQSNMVYRLNQMDSSWNTTYINEIASNDEIRCLKIDQDASLTEEESHGSSWLSNSSSATWTAVGSVFASQLHDATNVPVGIIWAAWGSSSIEGWLPLSVADEQPHFAEMMQLYQSIGEYRSGDPVADRAENAGFSSNIAAITNYTTNGWSTTNEDIFMRTRPNIIYNKMIHPMRNYGISGFIWYQGEANAGDIINVATYRHTFPRMIEEYRKRFDQGELPFLGVQLPSNSSGNTNWHWFREAQGDGLDAVSNAYYPVTVDTGIVIANGNYNVHPTDKEPIGVRLARLALKYALGESIEAHGPTYDSMSVVGNQVTISFTSAVGLTTTGGSLNPASFQLAGSDQTFHTATSATISGTSVIVSSSSESNPVAVRYAWKPNARDNVNLINGDGLPAAPFRTDDWPLPGLAAADPIANEDTYSILRDQTLSIPADGVLSNDFDINLDSLESNLVSPTTNGTLSLLSDGSFSYVPEAGFAGPDSFTYNTSELSGSGTSSNVSVSITVEGIPSSYYTWRSGIAWNSGDDVTVTGDPDGDGIENLLEFALGMDPLVSSTVGLPTLTPNGTGADYDFSNAQTGVLYEVLLSTDLITWSDPAFASLTNASTTPVALPSSEEEEGRLFVRLRVSEAD